MNIKIYGYFYTRSAGNIKNAKIKIKKKFFLTIFSINPSQIWKNRDIFTIMHENKTSFESLAQENFLGKICL